MEIKDLQHILLSSAPQEIQKAIQKEHLKGIPDKSESVDFEILKKVPCAMLPRWWALLHLTNGNAALVCGTLQFSSLFQRKLEKAEELFRLPAAENEQLFRKKISELTKSECSLYTEMLDTFIVFHAGYLTEKDLWEKTKKQGDILADDFLSITEPTLRMYGISRKKVAPVLKKLRRAAIMEPALNHPETLSKLAFFLDREDFL